MNPFASLQNDTVYVVSDAGVRSVPYKTAIGSNYVQVGIMRSRDGTGEQRRMH